MKENSNRQYFYYAKCLDTGYVLAQNENTVCESASTIKVAILAYLLDQVEKSKLSLRQTLKLKKNHHSQLGSGFLNNFYKTYGLSLHDLAFMMIIVSDNIATNALIELLDKKNINEYLHRIGLSKTKLIMDRLTFPKHYSIKDERIGETTPKEMAMLLEKLLTKQLLNSTHTELVKKFLKNTQSTSFGRGLLTARNTYHGVEISSYGNKTGACYYEVENKQVINDCGFFKTTRRNNYIFAVYSLGDAGRNMQFAPDALSRKEFAKASKQIYKDLVHESKPHP